MAREALNSPATTGEARLTPLEAEVAALERQADRGTNDGWLERVIGSTKDMPDFDEVVRHGRDARRAQPPPDDVPG